MDRVSRVSRYGPDDRASWNQFVAGARNTHFFFDRGFMDYHSDRFQDHSLLFHDDEGALRAVLPANRVGDIVHSHQGLSFGGLLVRRARGAEVIDMLRQGTEHLAGLGITRLVYKALPSFYHLQPSQDDCYALTRLGARLTRRELGSVIDLRAPFSYNDGRAHKIRRARKAGLLIAEMADPAPVMTLFTAVLAARHGVGATHTPGELSLLASRFPQQIRCFGVSDADRLLAGAVLFVNGAVAHTQYLANSDEGRTRGALDLLVDHLIRDTCAGSHWFSFGISTEDAGRHLNEGLLAYKEGFGAHGMVYDTYELDL